MPTPELMTERMKVVAYLVTGGRAFCDSVVKRIETAEKDVANRKDGSRVEPLVLKSDAVAALQSALNDKEAEIERLKKDAERYRWLRDEHEARDSGETFCVFEPDYGLHCLKPVGNMPGELDVAIDAAIDAIKGDAL